jgi:hypothetical protein
MKIVLSMFVKRITRYSETMLDFTGLHGSTPPNVALLIDTAVRPHYRGLH